MFGLNMICVMIVLLETGMLLMHEPVIELMLEVFAGFIRVWVECVNGKVRVVMFCNVPAFAVYFGALVEVLTFGMVVVDVVYGGMFYVIADVALFGFRLMSDEGHDIVRVSEMIKAVVA